MNKYKAVIFDMNGVIINDEHIHEMAFRETVSPYNIDLDHQAYIDYCAGKTDREGYEEIAAKFSVSLPLDDLLKQKSQMYLELFPANKKSYPGAIELIHSLAKEYTLALTSSSSRDEVDLITREFGINNEFKITVSGSDVKKGKPDPEPYLITADRLGFKPSECVVIEDSRSGVISAKAAGMYVVAITTTHKSGQLEMADRIISNFDDFNVQSLSLT